MLLADFDVQAACSALSACYRPLQDCSPMCCRPYDIVQAQQRHCGWLTPCENSLELHAASTRHAERAEPSASSRFYCQQLVDKSSFAEH